MNTSNFLHFGPPELSYYEVSSQLGTSFIGDLNSYVENLFNLVTALLYIFIRLSRLVDNDLFPVRSYKFLEGDSERLQFSSQILSPRLLRSLPKLTCRGFIYQLEEVVNFVLRAVPKTDEVHYSRTSFSVKVDGPYQTISLH